MQPSKADEISRAVPYAVGQRSEQAAEKEGFWKLTGEEQCFERQKRGNPGQENVKIPLRYRFSS